MVMRKIVPGVTVLTVFLALQFSPTAAQERTLRLPPPATDGPQPRNLAQAPLEELVPASGMILHARTEAVGNRVYHKILDVLKGPFEPKDFARLGPDGHIDIGANREGAEMIMFFPPRRGPEPLRTYHAFFPVRDGKVLYRGTQPALDLFKQRVKREAELAGTPAGLQFDEVRWKKAETGRSLLYLILTKPGAGTARQPADLVVQYAKPALRQARTYEGQDFTLMFFIRSAPEATTGAATGFTVNQLKEIAEASPDRARDLAGAHAWALLSLPPK